MYKSEVERIQDKNEVTYIAAYTILKKMKNSAIISKEAFERINKKIAERQNCIAFSN